MNDKERVLAAMENEACIAVIQQIITDWILHLIAKYTVTFMLIQI